jgi:hypothetical protein
MAWTSREGFEKPGRQAGRIRRADHRAGYESRPLSPRQLDEADRLNRGLDMQEDGEYEVDTTE